MNSFRAAKNLRPHSTEQHSRNQKKKAVHVHVNVNVYVDVNVDVDVNGLCHGKILSGRARISGVVVRRRRAYLKGSWPLWRMEFTHCPIA
jgi:hypothetical protein